MGVTLTDLCVGIGRKGRAYYRKKDISRSIPIRGVGDDNICYGEKTWHLANCECAAADSSGKAYH